MPCARRVGSYPRYVLALEYSRQWAVEENRSWNELYAVRAFLSYNKALRIVLFNDYLAKLERGMIEATYPQFLRSTGGALWLQRN